MKRSATDRDLKRAEGEIVALATEISSLLAMPVDARSLEMDTRIAHLLMLQAHELCRNNTLASELLTFYASFGAGYVVQDAVRVAASQDTHAELTRRMSVIRRAKGLGDGEYWAPDKRSPSYRKLDVEFWPHHGRCYQRCFRIHTSPLQAGRVRRNV